MSSSRGGFIIILTLAFGFAMRILPLPESLQLLNPDWLLLIFIYWCIALPDRTGLGTAWLLGLLADVATGQILGQQALIYCLVAYICLRFHQRLRLFPIPQQMAVILLLIFLEKVLNFWIVSLYSSPIAGAQYWVSPLIAILFWPILYLLLRQIRRIFHIQ
jgi:rod shape-determining protein MreD